MPYGFDESFAEEFNGWKVGAANGPPVRFGEHSLSDRKIDELEVKWDTSFPPDLKFLLRHTTDEQGRIFGWVDWTEDQIRSSRDWIIEGLEFDVRNNALWLERWGEKPKKLGDQLSILREDYGTWPKLAPVWPHRFISAEPLEAGNPVFSVYQSDVIYYGDDLQSYLRLEFGPEPRDYDVFVHYDRIKRVRIWSDFVDLNDGRIETF